MSRPGIDGECWANSLPTVAARQPFRCRTWVAALRVICDRDNGDLAHSRRLGAARLERVVRREITRAGGQKQSLRIMPNLFAALHDSAGVLTHRRGALERVHLLLEDWAENKRRLLDTETRMVGVLDELELTALVTSIAGLSAVGAAAILAETGDPARFPTARSVVKHAGLAPREKLSGTFCGRTRLTGQGRASIRLAARRAVFAARHCNPVYAARYQHLTSREANRLTSDQAQAAIAAALLRHLHAVIRTRRPWDPHVATHGTTAAPTTISAAA
ncbi:IS110 family transposase [Nocardia sp. NPDC004860]|uniref:IS110 family transposase n=1 Tax=Nocardia sp. NPDC004860 TaxID=3154557 RepID=UPI0033B5ACDE